MGRSQFVGAIGAIAALAIACASDDSAENTGQVATALKPLDPIAREKAFTAFESGQVRPLALSADGKLLFVTNTPDNRLEIFRVNRGGLKLLTSVPVGLEPVAVAERCSDEVWVVNHLSDTVSVVDVRDPERARVVRTLNVGDEPRDIVFAGRDKSRAFITTAHRGQNTGRDPQLTTPSVGRADVWVFDANRLGTRLGGEALSVITLFADTPRALAVTPDGKTVYAAAFQSGNRTTVLNERLVTNGGFLPPPNTNGQQIPQPPTALIVKFRTDPTDNQPHWLDNVGRRWDAQVKFNLPDKDVFAIDAVATPPVAKPDGAFNGVGTTLFNMAVNPVSGKVYVSNLEARNDVRFEGHNDFGASIGFGGSVRGHIAESRITVLGGGSVSARHLNKHLDYSRDGTPAEADKSLAFPLGMAVSNDGARLYVAAFGSSKVGVYSTKELEADSFVPAVKNEIAVSGGGPTGLVVDERRDVLYVMTRFDNGISIVDPSTKREIDHIKLYNPEPDSITNGRRFLYDARLTSSHGDSACASCHIFGDFDSLAWDLGDPDGSLLPIPGPFTLNDEQMQGILAQGAPPLFDHPLKGPMTTQSLRGMANHGPMHWRGDRTGGNDVPAGTSAQPDTGTFNEDAAFKKFNVAFPGLLGRAEELSPEEMQAFTDFMLQVTYPPNPIRALDNSLTAEQEAGRRFFFNQAPTGQELPSDTFRNCNGCHTLNPTGNAEFGVAKPGFFGSDGRYSFEAEPQYLKVPHLRNMYQKVGMFGMAVTTNLPIDAPVPLLAFLPSPVTDNSFQGDQVRGFGFVHDGSVDTAFRFFASNVFALRPLTDQFPNPFGIPEPLPSDPPAKQAADLAAGNKIRRQLEAFVLAFDSNIAPIVGQQATLTAFSGSDVQARVGLLQARADAGECELVVKGSSWGEPLAYLYDSRSKRYSPNTRYGVPLSEASLRRLALLGELTFTAVPLNSGQRIGLDRDLDGVLDGDDRRPTDPTRG